VRRSRTATRQPTGSFNKPRGNQTIKIKRINVKKYSARPAQRVPHRAVPHRATPADAMATPGSGPSVRGDAGNTVFGGRARTPVMLLTRVNGNPPGTMVHLVAGIFNQGIDAKYDDTDAVIIAVLPDRVPLVRRCTLRVWKPVLKTRLISNKTKNTSSPTTVEAKSFRTVLPTSSCVPAPQEDSTKMVQNPYLQECFTLRLCDGISIVVPSSQFAVVRAHHAPPPLAPHVYGCTPSESVTQSDAVRTQELQTLEALSVRGRDPRKTRSWPTTNLTHRRCWRPFSTRLTFTPRC
jgi:hypothetical protein